MATHRLAQLRTIIVARIALVSQDRARQIEAILLRMAQTGQLRGRVTEEQLIDLLEKVRVLTLHTKARLLTVSIRLMMLSRRASPRRQQ